MYESSKQRTAVEQWIQEQSKLPNRKAVQARFPDVPQKVVRKALQSCRDRSQQGC